MIVQCTYSVQVAVPIYSNMPDTVHTGLPVLFAGSWEVLGQNELSCFVLYIGLVNDSLFCVLQTFE